MYRRTRPRRRPVGLAAEQIGGIGRGQGRHQGLQAAGGRICGDHYDQPRWATSTSRDEILAGALATAFEDGLSRLSFGRVAKHLGVNDRIVVYYFPTKDDLVSEVVVAMGIQRQQALALAFAAPKPRPPSPSWTDSSSSANSPARSRPIGRPAAWGFARART
jgi:hypothetical protein